MTQNLTAKELEVWSGNGVNGACSCVTECC